LDCVMAVDMQVTGGLHGQVERAVPAELRQHVVEEPDPGGDVHLPGAVEVDLDEDPGLLRAALDAPLASHFPISFSAARNAAISSGVPTLTRSHSGGPTSRISTPRSSSASQTPRRSPNRPNSTKFASESATS